jgi:hypothetical protein
MHGHIAMQLSITIRSRKWWALLLLTLVPLTGYADDRQEDCKYWREIIVFPTERSVPVGKGTSLRIDEAKSSPGDPLGVKTLSSQRKLRAIECLLDAESDTRRASISGSTTAHSSQLFAQAPAKLAALYVISYIFTGKYDHALAVGFRGSGAWREVDGQYVTNDEAIGRAYASYREWFSQVRRESEWCKAQQQFPDPLAGTGLKWY